MQSLIRIFLLLGLLGGGYYFYSSNPEFVRSLINHPQVSSLLSVAGARVKGATTSLNIDADQIIDNATLKLTEKHVTSSDNDNLSSDTATSASAVSIQSVSDNITKEIKDIPKNQAKIIINNVCQQMLSRLDGQP